MFEFANKNAIFGVVQPDNVLWAPILGLFALTGIPTSGAWTQTRAIIHYVNKQAICFTRPCLQQIKCQRRWISWMGTSSDEYQLLVNGVVECNSHDDATPPHVGSAPLTAAPQQ